MKYIKTSKFDGAVTEITREQAVRILLGAYREDSIFEILSTPNLYPTMFSYIEVISSENDK